MGRPFWTRTLLAASLALSLGACRRGNVAGQTAQTTAPTLDAARPSRCGYSNRASKPLVVDWPAAERAALESRAMQGPVAVHWEGCEIEVLTTCNAAGEYAYAGLNPKQETVRIKNADELYANLPVGAASLEGKLERFGSLEVDMTVIGRKEATAYDFARDELEGRCDQATHIVTGLTVGAFTFSAGQGAAMGAGARVGNAGAGAQSSSSSELLNTDGDFEACRAATQADMEPPPGCGSLLRVELVPVDERYGSAPVARPNSGGMSDTPAGPEPSSSSSKPKTQEVIDLENKVQRMKMLYLAGYISALGFGLTSTTGFAMMGTASEEITASRSDLSLRDDAIKKFRTAQVLAWGGMGATVLGAVVGIAGLYGQNKAKARLQQISLIGGPQRGGASFGVRLKF